MHNFDNRRKMTRWYNPLLLAKTGFRAAISTTIGHITDNRKIHAALYPDIVVFDHSKDSPPEEDFWLDYVADLGDGWESTYAVAAAICVQHQPAGAASTHRGSILIMGGDEVYPDPSLKAYCDQTIAPWNAAATDQESFETVLYALPGNHDWYDGLQAFSDVFCSQGRPCPGFPVGRFDNLYPRQTRSYFALKLRQGWWMFGIDIQLNERIDSTQLAFFEKVSHQINPGDQIILCAPTPSWVRETNGYKNATALLASIGELLTATGGKLRLILAGDIHHYARYESADRETDKGDLTLITAGGGGAFMHPTHVLPSNAAISWQHKDRQIFTKEKCYPPTRTSQNLTYKNLLFLFYNLEFAATLGGIYMLLIWLLEARNGNGTEPLSRMFETMLASHISVAGTLVRFFQTIPKSPEFALLVIIFSGALVAFNQTPNPKSRVLLGLAHSFAHFTALVIIYCAAIAFVMLLPVALQGGIVGFGIFLLTMLVLGTVIGGTIFGLFLLFSLNVLHIQWTNAFSSLRIKNYKNFLRLKFAPDGTLTVFAFGIDNVPEDSTAHLIERVTIPRKDS